jgi:rubrerythrin
MNTRTCTPAWRFETLAKAERSHANRFQKALDTLDD